MPRMHCRWCGKDMGNHKYHDKGTCSKCRKTLSSGDVETIKNLIRINLKVDERSRTWE